MPLYSTVLKDIKHSAPVFLIFILLIFSSPLHAFPTNTIEDEAVIVYYEESLARAAEEVVKIYPRIKSELEESIDWAVNFRPAVLLIKRAETFQRLSGNNLIAAYAIPDRYLMVIDYSKMLTYPFTLETTLKHELSHLLLHHHIEDGRLPKWVDEGISQWVSEGIAELIMAAKDSPLKEAVLSGGYIRIEDIAEVFPTDRRGQRLAYDESRELVEYIVSEYGKKAVLSLLNELKRGDEIEDALQKVLSLSVSELEREWHEYLRKKDTWIVFISNNIYGILFFLLGLISIYGFIMLLKRHRAYVDEYDDLASGG